MPVKSYLRIYCFLFIIIEEHPNRRAMSDYNLHQMRDLDSYGDHLFCLNQKYFSFSTEEPQELETHLQTKISNGGIEVGDGKVKVEALWVDEHFEMGFMKEHKFILKKYIRNYMELFQGQSDSTTSQQIVNNISKEDYSLQRTLHMLQENTSNQPININEQLLSNTKIVTFLDFVLQEFQPCVSLTLLRLFRILWGEYMKLEDKKIGEREIIGFTNRLVTSAFLKRMTKLLPSEGKGVALATMKSFMNVMGNTLFFVGCEFFLNPYYQLQEELIVKEFHNYELFLYDSCIIDLQDQEEEENEQQECQQVKGRKLRKMDHTQ